MNCPTCAAALDRGSQLHGFHSIDRKPRRFWNASASIWWSCCHGWWFFRCWARSEKRPAVALACAALVLGYELPDLRSRLGPRKSTPWLPLDRSEAPSLLERFRIYLVVLLDRKSTR